MVCDYKWHSVVRVLFFILDDVFSVTTTCFVKTMVNARVVVTLLFKMTFQLKNMKENSHIDKNTFDYLKPDKPKAGRFYLLPKIRSKVNNLGKLIVSANGHPTEKISEFVDFHLRHHVEALPSHNERGRFGALKSDSTHHFFRNACTKSGSLRFSQFSGC
jgi:hypothetical protein